MRVEKRWVSSIMWLTIFVFAGLSGSSGTQGVPAFGGASDGGGGAGAIRASGEDDGPWELKLDADARLLLHVLETEQMDLLELLQDRLAIDYVEGDGDPNEHWGYWEVDVFILLGDPEGAFLLAELGVEVTLQVGDIAVARLPIGSLPLVAQQPFVQFVETSGRGQFFTDVSGPEIQADLVHQGLSLPAAYRGRGVVVGVVDSGIDVTHPDFSDPNGTRILHLLELLQGGGQTEWDKNAIDSNPSGVTERDSVGHGTHVAGIAAGGGKGNPVYSGVAREADIVFVNSTRGTKTFDASDIPLCCSYIFDKAQIMGKPAVINLSLGSRNHDKWALCNKTLSGLTGPGKIIVAAAGNDGAQCIHAGGSVSAGTTYGSLLLPTRADQAEVEIWYETGTLERVQVRAYKENQGQLTWQAETSWASVGGTPTSTQLKNLSGTILGTVWIDAQTTSTPMSNHGNVEVVVWDWPSGSSDISQTCWLIVARTKAAGHVHMWPQLPGDKFSDVAHNIAGITEWPRDANCTVASPAIAEKVISVGAYATKVDWLDAWGWSHNSSEQLGQLASFSSKGPTLDGRWGIDICAPGSQIAAALSSHASTLLYLDRVIEPDLYWLNQGTSMAAPHVTGVVALMLEANPTLDPNRVAQILRTTARSDAFTGSNLPDNRFGWGKVDALAAVQAAAASTPPVAQDVPVTAAINSAATVTLQAADDGLPVPPGALTYTIASLPTHGQLEDLGGTPIGQVPATLPGTANQVVYRPDTGWAGQDSFTFYADDGGTPPFGGPSNTATVQISTVAETTVEYQVSAGVDDVHLMKYSTYQNTSTVEIDLGFYTDGFRFRDIQIPQGAVIKNATLSICSYWFGLEGQIEGKLQAQAADNPADFTVPTQRLSLLPLTSASQAWNLGPASWTGDTWYDSPDIAPVLQEVIDRPGWTPGNALVLVYTTSSSTQDRRIWAYDGDPTKATKLRITYQAK